jgi:3-keto-5-aminohexanoate cleavage enzyme
MRKAIITCALTGVLTDPQTHPVPVSVEQMANSAQEAFDAGASIMHVHFRDQRPQKGHLPTWDPDVAAATIDTIRQRCPGVVINMSTGVMGADISGPLACLSRIRPDTAACNAGSLNYLKTRRDGSWAWPPLLFENPVDKVERFLQAMADVDCRPEFECFDTGIVRSIAMYRSAGLFHHEPQVNFVMGVASGMPADVRLLELLLDYLPRGAKWQVTAIGRQEIWALHRRAAELGGMLRSGVEDTFYLPDGSRCRGNGDLIEALVALARESGREVASPQEARETLGLRPQS